MTKQHYLIIGWTDKNKYADYESRKYKIKDNAIKKAESMYYNDGYECVMVRCETSYLDIGWETSEPILKLEV